MKFFQIYPKLFKFKKPSGTSRGVMTQKKSWFILLNENDKSGWGECSVIEGLSPDFNNTETYQQVLYGFLELWKMNRLDLTALGNFPSIQFGIETAELDLETGGNQRLFDTAFVRGEQKIQINGLIWMGQADDLRSQINDKLDLGFRCIKMKIGAMDWKEEKQILTKLRKEFSASDIEIRVDANGAYSFEQAQYILEELAALHVHSIEQPISAGQLEKMAKLCSNTPCPIALDEELIGVFDSSKKAELLSYIQPQYIILKPSLHGGISGSRAWIALAKSLNIDWWMTSALESNLGLNAIAQFASTYDLILPQGLGTGSLYTKNIGSPLFLEGEWLGFDANESFNFEN